MKRLPPRRPHTDALLPPPPRRIRPPRGGKLSVDAVRGYWGFSGATEGHGLPVIVWTTRSGACFWAALTDFHDAAILELIHRTKRLDIEQNGVT